MATRGERPATLSVVKSTGGPLSPTLIRGVKQWLCPLLVNEYGATETGGAAICLPEEEMPTCEYCKVKMNIKEVLTEGKY